jgi:hypothetical protein
MKQRLLLNTWALAFLAFVVLLPELPAAADVNVTQNIAFTANGLNPWAPGPAIEVSDSYTIVDIPYTHFDIPPINASPVDAALDALSDALGIPLPSVLKLQVGGSASGSAHVGFDFFASLGRLNINYPARSTLNVQTTSGPTSVRSNVPSSIGTTFEPGVSNRAIPTAQAMQIGGLGYSEPVLGNVSFTSYSTPKFATTAPWAEAKLVATADVHAGVYGQVKALGGLFKARKDFSFGGPVGGPLIEIDPSGLYVAGEQKLGVDLAAPYTFNIPGGTATAQLPKLGTSGAQSVPGGTVLHAEKVSPVFTVDGDLEKLIPFIGTVLHNSLGPFDYDLLHVGGGPVLNVYQDQTFTPDPQVRLTFSEPVLVAGQATNVAEFPLGAPLNWTPMFSNSSQITVVPQYILKNTFRNETGLDVSVQVNVDALSLSAPFIPGGPPDGHTIGPLIQTTETIPLARVPLPLVNRDPWEISLGTVTGDAITIPKLNLDYVANLGDLKFTLAEFVGGPPEDATYVLHFDRTVVGEPTREYEATVTGVQSQSVIKRPDDSVLAVWQKFAASQDVMVTDPVTSEQFNLGRDFSLSGYDWSELLPAAGPAFIAEDPDNPGQFLPALYVPTLADIPNTDVDVMNHPILGQQDTNYTNGIVNTEYGTEVIDARNGPATTILARTGDFTPEGDGLFNYFLSAHLDNSGAVGIATSAVTVGASSNPRGFYYADGSTTQKIVRDGDATPDNSGTLHLDETLFSMNDVGQIAFIDRSVFRQGPDGLVEIAHRDQAAPDGNGTIVLLPQVVGINDVGQVAIRAVIYSDPDGYQSGIYLGDGNSLAKIVRQGDTAPGLTGVVQYIGEASLNGQGQVALVAGNIIGDSAVYRGNGTMLTAVVVSGATAPNGGTYLGFDFPSINAGGEIAFRAYVDNHDLGATGPTAVYRWDGTEVTTIAIQGQTLSAIHAPVINDAGDVAFGADNGIYLYTNDALLPIAQALQPTPDGTTTFYGGDGSFGHDPLLNNHGQIAFAAEINGAGGVLLGIYVHDGTNLVEVARTGQILAGGVVTALSLGGLNEQMQVAYLAELADGRQVVARFDPIMYWHNLGDGDWGTAANWSLGVEPTNPYDVFIVAENALTVTGPTVDRTVKSLTIGGEDTANATLNLLSGVTLTATNGTTILPNGILNVPAGAELAGPLTNNGTLNGPNAPGQFLTFDDPVSGSGVFNGNMQFNNVISPGNSPGIVNIVGDVALGATATYHVELGGTAIGTEYDSLSATGQMLLDGTLSVSLLDGFVPALNDVFTVLSFASHSGDFKSYTGLDVGGYLALRPSFTATGLLLTARPAVDGDINLDGVVNIFDINSVSSNWGTAGPQGDANGDGIVNIFDVNLISANWGATGGSAKAVPEPATLILAPSGLVGVCYVRGRRRPASRGPRR